MGPDDRRDVLPDGERPADGDDELEASPALGVVDEEHPDPPEPGEPG